MPMNPNTRHSTRRMLWLALASFGFAFAMVPMYNIACEKVFGIKLDNRASAAPAPRSAAVDEDRTVQVYFDGSVNSKLPWRFTPDKASMRVVPGRLRSWDHRKLGMGDMPIGGSTAEYL